MYNASGEGDPEMDAATVYAIVTRTMRKKDWDLIKLVCFAEPNIDGNYYSEIQSIGLSDAYEGIPEHSTCLRMLRRRFRRCEERG